jgi:D-3-phosphoglycerate dehydrogenase
MATLLRLATVELLKPHLDTPVNVINVEHIARQRGIELVQIPEPQPPAGLVGDILGIRADPPDRAGGESHRVLGTVYADGLPRVLRIDGFAMDMIPEGQMVLIINKDQPGVIGTVGTTFGDASVNIADMVISRQFDPDGSAHALMVLKTDSEPPAALLNRLRARPGILRAKALKLPPRET